MQYIINNPFVGNCLVDMPFTDITSAKRQLQDIGENQRIYAVDFSYQALVTSASCIHSILSKSAGMQEEKRQLRLPGQVTSNIELLEYLNRQGEKAQGENRNKYNILAQAKQANKEKLEKALKELRNILYSVNRIASKYEYFFVTAENAFYDVDKYIALYIDKRIATCLQDTQDFFSDTKTALYCASVNCLDYRQVEKAGYKALNAYIYDFKKNDVHYCLDDENQTISINAMMKAMEINGKGNIDLRKAFNNAFKYLSKEERTTALCIGYGYTLEYIASLLGKSLATTFTYWKKAQGKLARLIPASALKCNIKPLVLAQAKKELQEIEQAQEENRKEQKRKYAKSEEGKEKNRARQKAYRERKKLEKLAQAQA